MSEFLFFVSTSVDSRASGRKRRAASTVRRSWVCWVKRGFGLTGRACCLIGRGGGMSLGYDCAIDGLYSWESLSLRFTGIKKEVREIF